MLTIKAPIQTKVNKPMLSVGEDFNQRIIGNYALFDLSITGEDFLHLLTQPPEIFLMGDEGITNIYRETNISETSSRKIEVVNNFLNRILLSDTVGFTYQDRVFITDALYKLGVKDDRRFMKAFYQIAEETKNTNTLINLYLERGGELRELIEEVESRERELVSTSEKTTETQRENYLYNTVLDRLNTGAIYQIVSNFNRTVENNNIDASEYSIADQSYTAQHILLSVLRERAGVGTENLVFLNENTYEETIENEENLGGSVKNEITAAVLMDMVKNIYHTGFDRFYTNNQTFYRFEDTFFKSSDKTFLRLVGGSTENYFTENIESENYYTENNRLTSSEIELLETRTEGEMSQEEILRLTETVNAINVQNEQRRIEYMQVVEELKGRQEPQKPEEGLKQTRRDAVLALTEPQKLMEKLEERAQRRDKRRKEVLTELRNIIPDQSMEVYQLLEQYYEGDSSVVNNFVRRADVGELIYDINDVENPRTETVVVQAPEAMEDSAIESLRQIRAAREEEQIRQLDERARRMPVETVHRLNETLTAEDITEQLNTMESNIKKNIKKDVETQIIEENHVTNKTSVVTGETEVNHLTARDVQTLVENGLKSHMTTISNQVINKLERQMKNEKMRRGY